MGIKFLCPGGHKLHVKAFLAGRKAVCPKCGQKVLVPTESEPKFAGKQGVHAGSIDENSDSSTAGIIPGTMLAKPMQIEDLPHVADSANATTDPFAEDPDAVWYVRPQSGGQFGPASAETMRSWVAEGRIAAESLVWRAGWPDWQMAESTFPDLVVKTPHPPVPSRSTSTTAVPSPPPPLVPSSPVVTSVGSGDVPYGNPVDLNFDPAAGIGVEETAVRARPRRKGTDTTVLLSGILVVVVIVLFIILGIVLSRQNLEPTPASPAKPPPKPAATENPEKEAAAEPTEAPAAEDGKNEPEKDPLE